MLIQRLLFQGSPKRVNGPSVQLSPQKESDGAAAAAAARETLSKSALTRYLEDIRRVPLLQPTQEVEYARQVQAMLALYERQDTLKATLGHNPTEAQWAQAVALSPKALSTTLQQGKKAREALMTGNLRLVVHVAKKYQNQGLPLLDLIQ